MKVIFKKSYRKESGQEVKDAIDTAIKAVDGKNTAKDSKGYHRVHLLITPGHNIYTTQIALMHSDGEFEGLALGFYSNRNFWSVTNKQELTLR